MGRISSTPLPAGKNVCKYTTVRKSILDQWADDREINCVIESNRPGELGRHTLCVRSSDLSSRCIVSLPAIIQSRHCRRLHSAHIPSSLLLQAVLRKPCRLLLDQRLSSRAGPSPDLHLLSVAWHRFTPVVWAAKFSLSLFRTPSLCRTGRLVW